MIEKEHKIPGGKLVRIRATIEEGTISTIEIHGDFFLHPEATISAIEEALIGVRVEEVADTVRDTLEAHNAQLIGCSPQDIQRTLE